MDMKRDYSLDIYRAFLMLGICLLHSITQAGHNTTWAANMLEWCVPGFVFISGWFGIKFSIGKALKLYGISFYCAVMYIAFDTVATGAGIDGNCIIRAWCIAKGQWFLNAYVIVMCLAPIVNLAIERMTIRDICPMLLCTFGWSFATTLPVVSKYVPNSAGLSAYSFLTLLGVYVVARFVRRLYDANDRFREYATNMKLVLSILVIALPLVAIGLGDYNSPFALILAGCVFMLFKESRLPSSLGTLCSWIGPSMFSVYLLHSHGQAWGYLKKVMDSLLAQGMPLGVAYLTTALLVFCLCVVADSPRRVFAIVFNKKR